MKLWDRLKTEIPSWLGLRRRRHVVKRKIEESSTTVLHSDIDTQLSNFILSRAWTLSFLSLSSASPMNCPSLSETYRWMAWIRVWDSFYDRTSWGEYSVDPSLVESASLLLSWATSYSVLLWKVFFGSPLLKGIIDPNRRFPQQVVSFTQQAVMKDESFLHIAFVCRKDNRRRQERFQEKANNRSKPKHTNEDSASAASSIPGESIFSSSPSQNRLSRSNSFSSKSFGFTRSKIKNRTIVNNHRHQHHSE